MITVLGIDDDAEDLQMFCEAIDVINPAIKCLTISDATEALLSIQNEKIFPDVIFTDINMPKMDGNEFLIELKKHTQLTPVPVVILSTAISNKDIALYLTHGSGIIVKPESFITLVNSLRSALANLNFL
jgi:CheY-like chemotaxis protein